MLENFEWIILEKLREEELKKNERPRLQLPIPEYEHIEDAEKEEVEEPKRVIIIDL